MIWQESVNAFLHLLFDPAHYDRITEHVLENCLPVMRLESTELGTVYVTAGYPKKVLERDEKEKEFAKKLMLWNENEEAQPK